MLDHPGHFLVHASAVVVGRRLAALSADEELEIGAVYAMFPMGRIGSVATAADLERQQVLTSGKAAARWAAGGQGEWVHGIPELDDVPAMTEVSLERSSKLELVDEVLMAELTFSKSMCRSRRPALQTITEELAF
ncbi:hypothetical protein HPP92_022824 [Vanilla planifolia]|uniref:Uncharacterized protein n=1 Tax=Vanilla planifolia TaxID=51239 RepID=A0A835PSV5_VANPL|nr:hypothetical protein HPP92_022824 [Vanilla planifolia]